MDWVKARITNLLDNLLWALLVLVVATVGTSALAWGSQKASLPIWLVVLFGVVQIASVVAIIALWHRTRNSPPAQAAPAPKHPHDHLLARIDQFDASLSEMDSSAVVKTSVAHAFNSLLAQASSDCVDTSGLNGISPVGESAMGGLTTVQVGDLRVLLGQVKATVEADTPSRQVTVDQVSKTMRRM